MHGMVNVLHGILMDAADTLLAQQGCTRAERAGALAKGLSSYRQFSSAAEAETKVVRSIEGAKEYLRKRGYSELMVFLSSRGVEAEVVESLEEAFALFGDMVTLAYSPLPGAAAIDQFEENAALLRLHCADLGLVSTPWAHVWTCHLPQFLKRWGTLCPWALWALTLSLFSFLALA